MIEFKGKLSEENKKNVLKFNAKVARWVAVIVSVPFVIIDIIVSLKIDLIYLIYLSIFVTLIAFAGIKPKGKELEELINYRIELNDEELIRETSKSYKKIKLSNIKEIIDCGDSYFIYFTFPPFGSIICQKNLITQGTIEEFEKKFREVIKSGEK